MGTASRSVKTRTLASRVITLSATCRNHGRHILHSNGVCLCCIQLLSPCSAHPYSAKHLQGTWPCRSAIQCCCRAFVHHRCAGSIQLRKHLYLPSHILPKQSSNNATLTACPEIIVPAFALMLTPKCHAGFPFVCSCEDGFVTDPENKYRCMQQVGSYQFALWHVIH